MHAILSSTASFPCEKKKNRYRKRNAEVREKGKKVKSKGRRRRRRRKKSAVLNAKQRNAWQMRNATQ